MVKPTMDELDKYKVEYVHESADDLLDTLSFMLLSVYANPDHWKLEYHGEPPHHLAKGLRMNFRPCAYPSTGGRAFAEEMIEKIRRFREKQKEETCMHNDETELPGFPVEDVHRSRRQQQMEDAFNEKLDHAAALRSSTLKDKIKSTVDEIKNMRHPEQVDFSGGKAASSKIPPLHLIPTVALEKTAERFQLGIERKGDKSWNALSRNQEVLTDLDFLIERTSHIIHHAAKLRDKLNRLKADRDTPEVVKRDHDPMRQIDEDDDASAIVWGGMFLQCAVEELRKEG